MSRDVARSTGPRLDEILLICLIYSETPPPAAQLTHICIEYSSNTRWGGWNREEPDETERKKKRGWEERIAALKSNQRQSFRLSGDKRRTQLIFSRFQAQYFILYFWNQHSKINWLRIYYSLRLNWTQSGILMAISHLNMCGNGTSRDDSRCFKNPNNAICIGMHCPHVGLYGTAYEVSSINGTPALFDCCFIENG